MSVINAPKWRRRKEARPREIVEAALASFAERGFAATKLDDIAARAGVTRGTLYLYFTGKEELFQAVVRQSVLPILESRERIMARGREPAIDLIEKLLLSIPEAITGTPLPAIPKLIVTEAHNFPDLARFYFEEVLARARRRLVALLRRGVRRGEFRALDVERVFYCVIGPIAAAVLWGQVFGRFDPTPPDLAAVCRAHAELLRRGLAR